MMSLGTIRNMQHDAAKKAAKEGRRPFVFFNEEELDQYAEKGSFPFAFLGNYIPKGWKEAEEDGEAVSYFVDSSGFGSESEPALSVRRFTETLRQNIKEHPGWGYAVTEAGQFQVYVGAFQKTTGGAKSENVKTEVVRKSKEEKELRRQVGLYADKFVEALKAGAVGKPGAGDCLLCCLVDMAGEPMQDASHVQNHLKEDYFVPSLALRACGSVPSMEAMSNSKYAAKVRRQIIHWCQWSLGLTTRPPRKQESKRAK